MTDLEWKAYMTDLMGNAKDRTQYTYIQVEYQLLQRLAGILIKTNFIKKASVQLSFENVYISEINNSSLKLPYSVGSKMDKELRMDEKMQTFIMQEGIKEAVLQQLHSDLKAIGETLYRIFAYLDANSSATTYLFDIDSDDLITKTSNYIHFG